ncbi:hypothetical protein J6590_096370 [Homalodisca vitripennis]|nr:hypothetical protein J6590_096370 [Homalodisca vitripennis]
MISGTVIFLDHLEKHVGEQRKFLIPNVLERIRFLLAESLSPQDGGRTHEVVAFQEAIEEMTGGSPPLVVDVQCLWLDKDYVIKEFAVTTDGMAIACITIKQLSEENPRSRRNQFVVDTIHSIRWEDGLIDESELLNYTTALFAPGREVVVKSCDKVDILVYRLGINRSDVRVIAEECPRFEVLRNFHVSDGGHGSPQPKKAGVVYRLGINRSDVRVIAEDCPRFEVLRNFHFSDRCVHHQGLSHRLGCASRHVHAMKCFLQGDTARHNRRKRLRCHITGNRGSLLHPLSSVVASRVPLKKALHRVHMSRGASQTVAQALVVYAPVRKVKVPQNLESRAILRNHPDVRSVDAQSVHYTRFLRLWRAVSP